MDDPLVPGIPVTALPAGQPALFDPEPPRVKHLSSVPAPASGFLTCIRADMRETAKLKHARYPSVGGVVDVLLLPGFWAVAIWRLANLLHHSGFRPLSRIAYFVDLVLFGADLQAGSRVGPGLVIPHPVGVVVASGSVIGARCRLMGGITIGGGANPKHPGHPVLGDDVWMMDSAKAFGPLRIGDRSIIGATAIVTRDVPADMFVYGRGSADVMRPLAEMDLQDHGGSLPA